MNITRIFSEDHPNTSDDRRTLLKGSEDHQTINKDHSKIVEDSSTFFEVNCECLRYFSKIFGKARTLQPAYVNNSYYVTVKRPLIVHFQVYY